MQSVTLKDRRSQTIARILKAATREFSEAGFAGARVDEIARSAGVNKATIYYHIGSKQALYSEVVHHLSGNTVEQLNRNLMTARSPEDKMKQFIQTVADLVDLHPEFAAIVLREQASGGKNFPEILAQDLARILGLLTEILDNGVTAGIFKKTEPLIIYLMIVGTIVFFKMSSPIRARFAPLAAPLKNLNNAVSGEVATEIEKIILNAVKK